MSYADVLGVEPSEVVRPDTAAEVAAIVARANGAGKAVIPWGGGTGQTYGYVPRRADVLLDLSGLNRILAHEPGDLTVTVEAGVTLDQVQDALALHNQFLPLDAPHASRATLGGILATNAFGPSQAGYGTARDWLLGLTVVDAQGKLIKGGGKVVKNVTGYDLPKLHVGALGTLGVLVEATFKVAPRPEAFRALLFPFAPGTDAESEAFVLRLNRETSPAFGILRDRGGARLLALIYSGPEEVAQNEQERALALAHEYHFEAVKSVPGGMASPFTDDETRDASPLVARLVGKASEAFENHVALTASQTLWERVDTLPGAGVTDVYLHANHADDVPAVASQLIQWASDHQTPLTFLTAPLDLRREERGVPLWSPLPLALPLMRRLKETLDPRATLNPGRFLGGI